VYLREEGDVLVDRQIAIQGEPLREIAKIRGDRTMLADWVVAENLHLTGIGRQQSAGDADGRGLSGAVRANQPEHLAGLDGKGHRVERAQLAVVLANPVEGDCGGHGKRLATSEARPRPACPASAHRHGCQRSL
jgi:hypothetical protein